MEVHNIVQKAVIKTMPKKKKCKKAKWLSEKGLQIAEKRREAKGKREKERYIDLNAEFHLEEGRARPGEERGFCACQAEIICLPAWRSEAA